MLYNHRAINKTSFRENICCRLFIVKKLILYSIHVHVHVFVHFCDFYATATSSKKHWCSSKLICKCMRCKFPLTFTGYLLFDSFCRSSAHVHHYVGNFDGKTHINFQATCIQVKYESNNACYCVKEKRREREMPTFVSYCTLYMLGNVVNVAYSASFTMVVSRYQFRFSKFISFVKQEQQISKWNLKHAH